MPYLFSGVFFFVTSTLRLFGNVSLELLCPIFGAVGGKIFKHSIATVHNFNALMRQKRLYPLAGQAGENNREISKQSLRKSKK